MDDEDEFQAQLNQIKSAFLKRLETTNKKLVALHAQLLVHKLDAKGRDELSRIAHDLSGTAAIFGYNAITNHAQEIETLLYIKPDCSDDELLPLFEALLKEHEKALNS